MVYKVLHLKTTAFIKGLIISHFMGHIFLLVHILLYLDVPRPLTNDIWVFLFQTIDAQCVK